MVYEYHPSVAPHCAFAPVFRLLCQFEIPLCSPGMMLFRVTLLLVLRGVSGHGDLPKDCRNQTWASKGGQLEIESYHIHYTTDSSGFKALYEGFVSKFQSLFPPSSQGNQCPFGPNYGGPDYKYVCSLEGALEEEFTLTRDGFPSSGDGPWSVSQRAFFIPPKLIDATWAWAQQNQGVTDVLLHGNTGCMHDDHSIRATWVTYQSRTATALTLANFPCNVPGTGCIDSKYPGPPSCGCTTPLKDDSPENSCKNCVANGGGPLSIEINV